MHELDRATNEGTLDWSSTYMPHPISGQAASMVTMQFRISPIMLQLYRYITVFFKNWCVLRATEMLQNNSLLLHKLFYKCMLFYLLMFINVRGRVILHLNDNSCYNFTIISWVDDRACQSCLGYWYLISDLNKRRSTPSDLLWDFGHGKMKLLDSVIEAPSLVVLAS